MMLARENEGSGLGLALIKAFVELHRGKAYVQSTLGEGIIVSFELPRREEGEEKISIHSSRGKDYQLEKRRVRGADIYQIS